MRLIPLVADELILAHSMHQALPSLPCCVGLHANFGTSHFQAFQVPTQHAILAFFPLSFFTPCQPNYFFFVVVRCAGCPISAPPPCLTRNHGPLQILPFSTVIHRLSSRPHKAIPQQLVIPPNLLKDVCPSFDVLDRWVIQTCFPYNLLSYS